MSHIGLYATLEHTTTTAGTNAYAAKLQNSPARESGLALGRCLHDRVLTEYHHSHASPPHGLYVSLFDQCSEIRVEW